MCIVFNDNCNNWQFNKHFIRQMTCKLQNKFEKLNMKNINKSSWSCYLFGGIKRHFQSKIQIPLKSP